MAVFIKDFDKPKACFWVEKQTFREISCPLLCIDTCVLQKEEYETWVEMYQNCPLEEVDKETDEEDIVTILCPNCGYELWKNNNNQKGER